MAKIEHLDIGDLWTPQFTWKVDSNNDGVPDAVTDPTQIVIQQKTPDGTISTLTTASSPGTLTSASTPLARISQGVFRLNPGITLNAAGYWFVRAAGTGAAEAAEEFQAIVDPSEFTASGGLNQNALVGLNETKDWLQHNNIDTGEDLELVRVINDVSQRIAYEAGREFKASTTSDETRTFDVLYPGRCLYMNKDLNTFTSASIVSGIDWTTTVQSVTASDVTLRPLVRESWQPARELQFSYNVVSLSCLYRVKVQGKWGFPAVPGSIHQAALDAIAFNMDRDAVHWQQDLGPQTGGGEANVIVLGGQKPFILSLPPTVLAVCRQFKPQLVS